ncbi:heavy metal efflux pump CzcA, partial [Pseudomonas syringae pv. actinidiae ICMP 19096]
QTTGLPVLTINIDRDKAARYGLNVADVQDAIAIALGGRQAGTLYEGDRRFDMVVRLSEQLRTDVNGLSSLLIPVPASAGNQQISFIALSQVASLDLVLGPNQISRENGKRVVIVSANVRGRDLGSFVEE